MVGLPGIYFCRKGTTALVRRLPTPPGALLSRMVTVFPWKNEVCEKATLTMSRSSNAPRERSSTDVVLSCLIGAPRHHATIQASRLAFLLSRIGLYFVDAPVRRSELVLAWPARKLSSV